MRGKQACILICGILEAAPFFLIRSIVRNTDVSRHLRWQPEVLEKDDFAAKVPPDAFTMPCQSQEACFILPIEKLVPKRAYIGLWRLWNGT